MQAGGLPAQGTAASRAPRPPVHPISSLLRRPPFPSPSKEHDAMTTADETSARALADRFWEDFLRLDPLVATEIGDERYDDRLPDPSEAGIAERAAVARGALDDLQAIDRGALGPQLRGTLDMIEAGSRRELERVRPRTDRVGAVTHMFGPGNLLAEPGA